MRFTKQVQKEHYRFTHYMSKPRWISVWHQLDEVQKLIPEKVLEIGPGPGLFKLAAGLFGIKVETLDFDPDLNPDYVGSITQIPLHDASYDVVCAFQVLEHLPYEMSLKALAEMARVSRRHILISLPDSRIIWRYLFHIPKIPTIDVLVPRPFQKVEEHMIDREHYWEINKKGYELKKVLKDFSGLVRVRETYLVPENPYHRFFCCERL